MSKFTQALIYSTYIVAEFGFGKATMGIIIGEEAKDIIDNIATSSNDQDFMVEQTFNISVFNVLWRIVSGKRYQVKCGMYSCYQYCYILISFFDTLFSQQILKCKDT